MRRHSFIKVSAVALAVAGLSWSFKAAAIMVTGDQPTLTFELGQFLFPIGTAGIYLTINRPRRLEKIGLMLAILGFVGSVLALLYSLLPGAQISTGEEFVFPSSLFVLIGSAGGFVALLLLGIAIMRTEKHWGRWRTVPVIVALIPLPLIVTSAIHFEMPIFLIGIAWLLLAYGLWRIESKRSFNGEDQPFAA